jgi:hypothetical protein
MKKILLFFFMLFSTILLAQTAPERVNEQRRFFSDNRLFYVWNQEKDAYDLKDTEFENSIIDIREIGSKNNGYIVISLNDDGKARLYHGSIISYTVDEGVSTWVMRSKNARGKLVLDPKKKQFTYSFESNETRYVKIFIFNLFFDEGEEKQP